MEAGSHPHRGRRDADRVRQRDGGAALRHRDSARDGHAQPGTSRRKIGSSSGSASTWATSSSTATDIAGEGVNVAARLETLAEAGWHLYCRDGPRARARGSGREFCRHRRAAGQEHRAADPRLSRHIAQVRHGRRVPRQGYLLSDARPRRRWLLVGIAALGAIGVGVVLSSAGT